MALLTSLTPKDKQTLQDMIDDGPKSFKKLYCVKDNGCDAVMFHSRCDNRGPTLTLVYNSTGEVYGGYTSVSWQSYSNKPVYDSKAFLFILTNQEGADPIKFKVNDKESAILMDGGFGPTFGSGPDMRVCLENVDDSGLKLKTIRIPGSYEDVLGSLSTHLGREEQVCEVAVYRVNDTIQNIMDVPWRSEPKFEKEYLHNLMREVEDYWPLRDMGVSEDALPHVNVLLLGAIGAGKSSFLNSVESAFRGHVTMTAGAGSRDRSVTSSFRKYEITASNNKQPLRFKLCDCRGLEDSVNITQDIDSILEGHLPNNYVINTSSPLKGNMHGYNHHPRLEDKIHCVVYVLDAQKHSNSPCEHAAFISDDVNAQLQTIQENIDQKGIPQLILLNKVDDACESTKRSTSNVYRSSAIRERCVAAADRLGLPPMTVLPMKNYFMEPSTVDDISILALFNIRQMLRAADTFLRVNHLNDLRTDKYENHYY